MTTDINATLAAIRERAEKATDGPWYADGSEIYGDEHHQTWIGETCDPDRPMHECDANGVFAAHARSDVPRLLAAVEAVTALHHEYRIYHDCDHEEEHTEQERDDGFVLDVDDIGETCERSYMYSICSHCCADDDVGQVEDCVIGHPHGRDKPWCRTLEAIADALNGADHGT